MTTASYVLGINAAFHDSSACLLRDGLVVAAAEEERFTGIKHAKRPTPFSTYELPFHALDYCLKQGGIGIDDVQHLAYSYDPGIRLRALGQERVLSLPLEPSAAPVAEAWEHPWDPLFLSAIVNAPRHLAGGVPHHLRLRLTQPVARPERWHFVKHHVAHAASAFIPSPFTEAAILVMDGRGETATTTYAIGTGNSMTRLNQVDMPHSLGLLYEDVTEYLGFLRSSDEYKVMALASFGQPAYERVFQDAIELRDRGGYVVHPPDWERLGPRRLPGEPVSARHHDIARSLQKVLEDRVLAVAAWLRAESGLPDLCLAGGVALNCVLNARLRDSGLFRRLWVQPAAGDAGTALGAALWVDARERSQAGRRYCMEHTYLGPDFSEDEMETALVRAKLRYRRPRDLCHEVAALLARDRIVGWFQGRMEFGPRALGARSLLASPREAAMQERLNDIKDREDFRPVAPAVLAEEAGDWFVGGEDPFMLFVAKVRPERLSQVPAVCHVDGTARVQTVTPATNPLFHQLLREFKRQTGVPVLINTSFNIRGRPIVCTPADALQCFFTAPLDALAMGPFLLEKPGT